MRPRSGKREEKEGASEELEGGDRGHVAGLRVVHWQACVHALARERRGRRRGEAKVGARAEVAV